MKRIVELDVLRGIALFGILVVNLYTFHSPFFFAQLANVPLWETNVNQITYHIQMLFFQGKFYTIFSFLFGLGFMLFMASAERRSLRPEPLFIRRLLILLVFGVLHTLWLWEGDILTWYALTGFALLGFWNSRPRTLLLWAYGILASYVILLGGMTLLDMWASGLSSAANETMAFGPDWVQRLQEAYVVHREGSYTEIMQFRLQHASYYLSGSAAAAIFLVLPMFLFGLYAAKTKLYLPDSDARLRRIFWMSLPIGVLFTAVKFIASEQINPEHITVYDIWEAMGMVLGDIGLCFVYASGITLLVRRKPKRWIWRPTQAVGRMALTNYIIQTIVCTTVFYGYGLGYYGQINPLTSFIFALVLYSLQAWGSILWLRVFKQGPLEWLWRKGIYGRKGATG